MERLGEGGMGQVFKARHQHMGRIVALKLMRKEKLTSTDSVTRFYQEMKAVGADEVEEVTPGLLHECARLARDPAQCKAQGQGPPSGQRGLRADQRLLACPPIALHERVVVIQVVDAVGLHGDEVAGHDRVADRPRSDGGRGGGHDEARAKSARAVALPPPAPQADQRHEGRRHGARQRGQAEDEPAAHRANE